MSAAGEQPNRDGTSRLQPRAGSESWGRNVSLRWLGALVLSCATALSSGCGRSAAESPPAVAPVAAATYNASRGLRLSAQSAAFIMVETTEASARGSELRIPSSALLRTIKGTFVYVANGEWYLRAPVTLSREQPDKIASLPLPATSRAADLVTITDGLYEGDRVVSRGTDALWLAEIHAVNGGVSCAHGH